MKLAAGALFKDGRLLLMKRAETRRLWPGEWSLPGGKAKEGETLDECLKREFHEETKINIDIGKKFNEFTYDYDGTLAKESHFIVTADNFNVVMDPSEHSEFKWVTEEELDNLNICQDVRDSLTKLFTIKGQ